MQKAEAYIFEYPEMLKHEKLQMESFWLPSEPKIENEVHEILTGLEPSEYHGVITVLKLFTEYERRVGGDYWSGRFKRMFPRPEFERVAIVNAMTEINIHAPFYNQINELLRLDTIEFYNSYKSVKSMADRMDFIGSLITSKNDMLSLAAFTMVEGAVLYSNFAFLKHFQANGKNKIKRIVSGIDFSTKDEALHSLAGAHAFRIAMTEIQQDKLATQEEVVSLINSIYDAAHAIAKHEDCLIDEIKSKGEHSGCSSKDMKAFIRSRLNLCLENLGLAKLFSDDECESSINAWFYSGITMPTIHDFFAAVGSQYHRNWSESGFVVPKKKYKFVG